jgi:hypothetical protein
VLKGLEVTYTSLTSRARAFIESREQPRANSPQFFKPPSFLSSRPRSNTDILTAQASHRRLASALAAIDSKYTIVWECAELLIELGGGTSIPATSPPNSVSEPAMLSHIAPSDCRKNRERAITLAGDESKPMPAPMSALSPGPVSANPVNLARHTSTERHQLSRRQVLLLQEILNNAAPSDVRDIKEGSTLNRDWRWGDAMSSTVTLPSEGSQATSSIKKARTHRLRMDGLRNMLRALKRTPSGQSPTVSLPSPPTDLGQSSTKDSVCQHENSNRPVAAQQRGTKSNCDCGTLNRPLASSLFQGAPVKHRASPRRPSLASIFRLGQKGKMASMAEPAGNIQSIVSLSSGHDSSSVIDEGDWDQMDSASDLDATEVTTRHLPDEVNRSITARGRSPHTFHFEHGSVPNGIQGPSESHSPITSRGLHAPLSVGERAVNGDGRYRKGKRKAGTHVCPARPSSPTACHSGSMQCTTVLSLPPPLLEPSGPLPNSKLALTPENIRPLLENSREVLSRLHACIAEVCLLLDQ